MRAVIRNLVLVTGSRALDGAVRFLTVPIVLGYFGREDFGLLALAYSIHAFLTIADFGISVNAVRRLSESITHQRHDEVRELASATTFFYGLIGLVNLAGVLVVGQCAQAWFGLDERHAASFAWMMLGLGLSSALTWTFSIYRQILHASGQVGWDESINLVASALTVCVVWATLHWQLSIAVYFALVLSPPLVPLMLRMRRVRRTVPGFRFGLAPHWATFKPVVGTSAWLFVLTLGEMLANNYRPIILAQQAGLSSVADFRIIQQVAGFATLLLSGFMSVLYPAVARLDAAKDDASLAKAVSHGSRVLLWVHLALLVPMAFLAEPMLSLYVGRSFAHLSADLAVWLLSLVAYHNSIVSSLVLARGRLAGLTTSSVLSAALTLGAAYLLAPTLGVKAVVWTYSAYLAIQLAFIYVVALTQATGTSGFAVAAMVFPRPVVVAALVVALCVAAVQLARLPLWVAGLLFAPVYAAVAWTVGGVRGDLAAVRRQPA